MTLRVAAVALVAALSLVACDSTSPTVSPTSIATPSTAASAEPSAAIQIDDPAYLAGDAFVLPKNYEGMDWLTPSSTPVMPNGQPAVRVAFVPTSCATGDFVVQVGLGPPKDPWEESLSEAFDEFGTSGSWPAAERPECAEGRGRTYLEVGYHPLAPGTIHLGVDLRNAIDAPTEIELVPVYTSADATQPSWTMASVVALEPQPGPKKLRKATPQEVVSTTFARATLPDGTAPDQWSFRVTGCGSGGPTWIEVSARIGDEEPVEVGQCSGPSFSIAQSSWPVPAEGTPIAVLMAGGTTKSFVQVAEFQWRGDRN